ncbi:MAG: glycosyltransferase family 39 protein [Planctomycetota bacterium]
MKPSGSLPVAWRRRWLSVRAYLIPLAVLLCVTLPHLDQGDWRTDTARYAAVGLQAWDTGEFADLYHAPGEHYFKKPPLGMWIHGLALHVFGVDLVIARLPTVLAAAVCVLATVWLVRAVHGRGVALGAGLALALSYEFFRRVREVSLDMWQLAFMLIAAGFLLRALIRGGVWRAVLGGVFVGLALMTKPLVGLLVPVMLGGWALASGNAKRAWLGGVAAVVGVLVALPWHGLMIARHGDAFIDVYFKGEIADRAAGEIVTEPWWYYLGMLAQTGWPWLAFAVVGMVWLVKSGRLGRSASGPWLAVIWTVCWLVLLSVFPDKRPRYLMPALVGLAWLAGAFLAAGPLQGGRRLVRTLLEPAVAVGVLGAAVFAVLPVRVQEPPDPDWIAVFEQLEDLQLERVVTIGANSNQRARFYVSGFTWPEAWDGRDIGELEAGTVVLRRGNSIETERERRFFKSGILKLSRVRAESQDQERY